MKLLVSDFDGTLNRRGSISARDAAAIRLWQDAGNKFVIATGRGPEFVPIYTGQLPFVPDGVCGSNGALIMDAEGKIVASHLLPPELVTRLCALGESMGSERIERCGNGLEPDAICQLRFRFPSGEHSERFLAAMDALRADVWIYRYEGRVTVGNPRYTKGAGAAYFARLWGIADKDVHTVGDARNDLSMLEAYHGFSILGGELGEEYPYRTPDVASVCLKYL